MRRTLRGGVGSRPPCPGPPGEVGWRGSAAGVRKTVLGVGPGNPARGTRATAPFSLSVPESAFVDRPDRLGRLGGRRSASGRDAGRRDALPVAKRGRLGRPPLLGAAAGRPSREERSLRRPKAIVRVRGGAARHLPPGSVTSSSDLRCCTATVTSAYTYREEGGAPMPRERLPAHARKPWRPVALRTRAWRTPICSEKARWPDRMARAARARGGYQPCQGRRGDDPRRRQRVPELGLPQRRSGALGGVRPTRPRPDFQAAFRCWPRRTPALQSSARPAWRCGSPSRSCCPGPANSA